MLAAILILLLVPVLDFAIIRGSAFRPLSKIAFGFFVCNFLLLGVLGAQHIEIPYIALGQFATVIYFSYFIIILPLLSILENGAFYLGLERSTTSSDSILNGEIRKINKI